MRMKMGSGTQRPENARKIKMMSCTHSFPMGLIYLFTLEL